MKTVFLTIHIVMLFLCNVENNDIEVSYTEQKRYTVEEYIDKYVKTDNPAVLDKIRETYDKVKTEYLLVQNGDQSSYYAPDFVDSKEGNSKVIRAKNGTKHQYTSLAARNVYHKNFRTGEFQAAMHSRSGKYTVLDDLPKFSWSLNDAKSRTILGYKCNKATIVSYKGFDVEAWYTTEIPISNGPMEYGHLPGLILELSFASFKYSATEINFNCKESKNRVENIQNDSETQPYSWQEYIDVFYK